MDAFDYIIVGAGSAGCVLTNRLSEDGKASICLLEAAPPDPVVPGGGRRLGAHGARYAATALILAGLATILRQTPNRIGTICQKKNRWNFPVW